MSSRDYPCQFSSATAVSKCRHSLRADGKHLSLSFVNSPKACLVQEVCRTAQFQGDVTSTNYYVKSERDGKFYFQGRCALFSESFHDVLHGRRVGLGLTAPPGTDMHVKLSGGIFHTADLPHALTVWLGSADETVSLLRNTAPIISSQ